MTPIDHYAVFGSPIKHSKSPQIHRLFAEQTGQSLVYSAQEVTADAFNLAVDEFFRQEGKGLNCTVPLKELAWSKADRLTERAQLSKAVNTLALQADGLLLGDNTDGAGLITDLTVNHSITLYGKKILILGAGGATRGILGPILNQLPHCLTIANRTVTKAEMLANEFTQQGQIEGCGYPDLQGNRFDIIINATSASLHNQLPPLPNDLIDTHGICYDLAYANEQTAFVRWGQTHGAAKSMDGLGMLVEQAAAAFSLWRNVQPETGPIIDSLNSARLVSLLRTELKTIADDLNTDIFDDNN